MQLYLCKACKKTFTPQIFKHKHYSLRLILDGVSLYNLGYTRSETCQLIKGKYGPSVKPSTLTKWINELDPLCRYARFRKLAQELYSPHQVIKSITLNHQQVYQYRYHQAKLDILFDQRDYSQEKFQDLKTFLTLIERHCPHDYFQSGSRSSKSGATFDLDKVTIKRKQNHATRLAQLVLQAVAHNRLRHEAVQQFMLANDKVSFMELYVSNYCTIIVYPVIKSIQKATRNISVALTEHEGESSQFKYILIEFFLTLKTGSVF